MQVTQADRSRLKSSVALAMQHGKGIIMLLDNEKKVPGILAGCSCVPLPASPTTNLPRILFHSIRRRAPVSGVNGLGTVNQIDIGKSYRIPSWVLRKGVSCPWSLSKRIDLLAAWGHCIQIQIQPGTPIKDIPEDGLNVILYGAEETFKLENTPLGFSTNYFLSFEGVINLCGKPCEQPGSERRWEMDRPVYSENYLSRLSRSPPEKRITAFPDPRQEHCRLSAMDISELFNWLNTVEPHLNSRQQAIATEIIKELKSRIGFLLDVGLDYLSLNRSAGSLSGGESQRIRLATQIGSQLVNVLYILDEPSIGLHQRDNQTIDRLVAGASRCRKFRDRCGTWPSDDHECGLRGGPRSLCRQTRRGGLCTGSPEEILRSCSLTAQYLNHQKIIGIPEKRRDGNGKKLIMRGATATTSKHRHWISPGQIHMHYGVSGSGKSSVIYDTLYPCWAGISTVLPWIPFPMIKLKVSRIPIR